MRKLDNREARFVDEYLIHLDPCKAALAAGYSATIARSKAYQWVSNSKVKPHVHAAIQNRMEERSEKAGITQERVLQELSRLAFLDIRKAYNLDGSLKPLHELDDDTAAAIAGMEVAEMGDGENAIGFLKKIKLSDKKGALELVMRHMGMFQPKGQADLDAELKRLEIEKRKAELKLLQQGGQSSNAQLLADLIARLPG
ncbi:terminase small subunit [Pseudomonas abietaniphila]|uniref:terminase small subunit n=1 Tax=Pseudomonas abietaniphila TaxID=89065 RepID=UPI0007829D20|nr:terminase small subunit [Pseudomonas abietaniphila]